MNHFDFVLVHWPKLLEWWIISYETSWRIYSFELFYLVILSWMRLNVNICWLVNIYVKCIYVDWWLYMLSAYMLIGDYICWMHICWWWIYMLCAYMLLVKSFTCDWWWIVGVRMYWNKIGVDLWNYRKYVLLLSSPSSHTLLLLLSFISNCCWMMRYSLFGVIWRVYKRQGRRPQRWKKFGTTHSWVGLVTLSVSRRVILVMRLVWIRVV